MTTKTKKTQSEIKFNDTTYVFSDLTVGQMEILSEIFHDARKAIFDEITDNGENILSAAKLTLKIGDIISEMRRQKKYALFLAACLVEKGQVYNEDRVYQLEKVFKNLPDSEGEKVIDFFFNGAGFRKVLMPNFLTGVELSPEK